MNFGDRVTGNTFVQGRRSSLTAQSIRRESLAIHRLSVHWRKTNKPESHSTEGFNLLHFFCQIWYFVCLAAEPTVNKSYLSLWIVVLRWPGQRRAFTIEVYESITNQWEGRRSQSDSAFLLLHSGQVDTENMLLHINVAGSMLPKQCLQYLKNIK